MQTGLPKDPALLLSVVNTKLRDYYPTLDALCEDMDIEKKELVSKLEDIGYEYDENKKQFYVPEGFAHGYYVMSDTAVFSYKCTEFYHPEDEGGILWNDPEIGVEWPIEEGVEVLLSEKDRNREGIRSLRN